VTQSSSKLSQTNLGWVVLACLFQDFDGRIKFARRLEFPGTQQKAVNLFAPLVVFHKHENVFCYRVGIVNLQCLLYKARC
jgi:hypothetical protein